MPLGAPAPAGASASGAGRDQRPAPRLVRQRRGLGGGLHHRVGGFRPVRLDHRAAHPHVAVEVDAQDHVGAERAGRRHRHRIDQRPVHQPAPGDLHRIEDARQRVGRAHRLDETAAGEPDLVAAAELGRHRREGQRQVLDAGRAEVALEQPPQALAGDQPRAADVEIEQAITRRLVSERAKSRSSESLPAAWQAPTAAPIEQPAHHVDGDAGFPQDLDRPDMRPAPGGPPPSASPTFARRGGLNSGGLCSGGLDLESGTPAAPSTPSAERRTGAPEKSAMPSHIMAPDLCRACPGFQCGLDPSSVRQRRRFHHRLVGRGRRPDPATALQRRAGPCDIAVRGWGCARET